MQTLLVFFSWFFPLLMSRLQNYFSPEFIASGLDKEFFNFVSKLTQAKSKTVSIQDKKQKSN